MPGLAPAPSGLPPGATPLPNAGRRPLRLEQPIEPARAVATVPVSPRAASSPRAATPAAADRVEPAPPVVQSG
jgi:hypothetical protein